MYYNWYSSYLAAQYNSDADFICVAKPKNDPQGSTHKFDTKPYEQCPADADAGDGN